MVPYLKDENTLGNDLNRRVVSVRYLDVKPLFKIILHEELVCMGGGRKGAMILSYCSIRQMFLLG